MKKIILISALALMVTASSGFAFMKGNTHQQNASGSGYPCQMGPGMMGYGMMGGGYGMGPGMMRGDYGMGQGMMGGGYGMGQGYYDTEQYGKFMKKTHDLRKKIHDKQFEYFEAARDPKATQESLMIKDKELFELNKQMQEKVWESFKK